MGSVGSVEHNEADPWWPQTTEQHREPTVFGDNTTRGNALVCGKNVSMLEDEWQRREKELCRTIQHLAEENMRLATVKRERENVVAQVEAVHSEDQETIASLRSNMKLLSEELVGLRLGFETERLERQRVAEIAIEKEAECNTKHVQQIQILMRQKEDNLKEIERLRRELILKCEAIEIIRIQLIQEKQVGNTLLSEAEKLKIELQNINTSKTNESADSAERVERVCVINAGEETSDVQGSSDRDGRVAEEIEKFKAEMSTKREARQRAMMAISSEMERLRNELASEREQNKQMAEELNRFHAEKNCDHHGCEELYKTLESERDRNSQLMVRNEYLSSELNSSEQMMTAKTKELEDLRKHFDLEREQYHKKVSSLKEVVSISKQLLSIREKQVDDLHFKLNNLESLVKDKSQTTEERVDTVCYSVTAGLRQEYQVQLENIKSLKSLYDERLKVISQEKDKLSVEFEETCKKLEAEQKKSDKLETELSNLRQSLSEQEDGISNLQTQLDTSKDEARDLARELTLINNLFAQMLVSSSGSDIDLDKLTKSLQENHDLISEITLKESSSEIAACLPKLVLELVAEVDKSTQSNCGEETENIIETLPEDDHKELKPRPCTACQENNTNDECNHNIAVEDIALNLPKVWKVLMELLSHHITPTERPSDSNEDCCYKRVDTPYGPRLAISVSKTFLRLKDLILEKKSLKRELVQLKQLNCHLENRLSEQEQRLSLVSSELHKTWSVVGRMRTQHQQLHNHEKILRYELQQKRKLLTELKQELEYCRETWEMAREKNSQSEEQWRVLRKEFSSRKKNSNSSLDNSGESGFSDDKEDDSGGEDELMYRTSKRGVEASYIPEPSESSVGCMSLDMSNNTASPNHSELVPSVLGVTLEESQVLPPLVIDVTHEHFLAEEVCPLKSPPTPEFLESSAHVTVHDGDSAVDTAIQVECPVEKYCGLECSTISLISLMKQQLSCFSRNLDEITSDFRSNDNHQALQSIFFLPDIKVPYYDQSSDINNVKCANCLKAISANDTDSVKTTSDSSDSLTKRKPCSFLSSADSVLNKSNNVENEQQLNAENCRQVSSSNEDPSSSRNVSEDNGCTGGEGSVEGSAVGSTEQESGRLDRLGRTPEQVLQAREARLRRLEEQCEQLVRKVTNTTNRSAVLSNRLEELHGQYGEIPQPPPCPTILPAFRIPHTTAVAPTQSLPPPPPPPPPPPMPSDIPALRIPTESTRQDSMQNDQSRHSEISEDSASLYSST